MVVIFAQSFGVALAGAGNRLRLLMVDFLKLVTARLADADRLAAKPRLEMADCLVVGALRTAEPGTGGDAVGHGVLHQLGPTLAPEIIGDLGAVGGRDKPAHFVRALGDAT